MAERLGGDAYFRDEQYAAEEQREGGTGCCSRRRTGSVWRFISLFWACNVAPYFAIFTFAPTVLKSLQLHDEATGTIIVNAMAAIGALVGMLTIERLGRRRQLIPRSGSWRSPSRSSGSGVGTGIVVVLCFAVFSFMNAAQGNLTAVYPIEVLPTEVRSTGVGFAAACSRVGAAPPGRCLLPIGIDSIGIGACMLIAAAICVVGAVLSQVMAPETTGKGLHDTSTQPLREQTRTTTASR